MTQKTRIELRPSRIQLIAIALIAVLLLSAAVFADGLIAANTAANSITVSWTAPGDDSTTGTAASYDIRYSTSTITSGNWALATQATGEPTPLAAGTSQSFTIASLQSSTTYYVGIKAADSVANWSGLSNIVAVTTAAEQYAPSNIANLATSNITAAGVTLTWTAPGDDSTIGTATTYDIRYFARTITAANWDSATQVTGETAPKAAGTTESFTISGLTYNTRYYFAIKTADEVPNWSGLSNIVNAVTLNEQVAPANIANLATSSPTGTTITLTWTAPGDDANTGTATSYDIRYFARTITAANWDSATQVIGEPAPHVAGTSESFAVTGLQSHRTYYFAIKTADEVPNVSGLSNVASGATLDINAPAAIRDLHVSTGTNLGELNLGWTAPGNDSMIGLADAYLIKIANYPITEANWDSIALFNDPPAPLGPGSSQSFTMTGLEPARLYYVGIKAIDSSLNIAALSNVDSGVAKFIGGSGIDNQFAGIPTEFDLAQNYPNPFNPSTKIKFSLPEPAQVKIEIFDARGSKVITLTDCYLPAGFFAVNWNGQNSNGQLVSSGMYFYRIVAGNFVESRTMAMIK